MTASMEFTIGSGVVCGDGACGELKRVVVDPVARALTHLVVEPTSKPGTGRLVPIELVDSVTTEIRLRCTLNEFHALEQADETHFLDGGAERMGYQQGQSLSLPLYALGTGWAGSIGMGGMGLGIGGLGMTGMASLAPQTITEDRVPEGEMEARRGDRVQATDGEIGRIRGFVINPTDRRLTHILLDEGHLWSKKTVAIPVSAVKDLDDGVRLNITKDAVGELPSIDLDES